MSLGPLDLKKLLSSAVQTTPAITLGSPTWAQDLHTLPASPGVFCIEVNGRITYLSSAPNLRRRVERVVAKLGIQRTVGEPQSFAIHCWASESKLHTSLLVYQLAKQHFPEEYLQRTHLRMPWFVSLLTRDPFPRLLISNRIPSGCGTVVGPFPRRELAQLYEQELQSAFSLRRCSDVLHPHPEHPGCIYGEMRQCLRPCQCAVDESQYRTEATSVLNVLGENGTKTLREKVKARDQAIEALDFERAAQIHRQYEKLATAKSARSPIISDVQELHGVALVPAHSSGGVQLFPIIRSCWHPPAFLSQEETAIQGRELEAMLRSRLNFSAMEEEPCHRDRLEDLALFARWVFSSWRDGVWIPFARLDDPPFRKLARGITGLARA